MMLFPAFQYLFEIPEKGAGHGDFRVFGTETLARFGAGAEHFQRPEGVSWRSIDYGMLLMLGRSPEHVPGKNSRLLINVSQFSLVSDDVFHVWFSALLTLKATLANTGTSVIVEITEHVTDAVLRLRWSALKSAGFLLAIDDFGTGLSDMRRLTGYDWDLCKFDMHEMAESQLIQALRHCELHGIQTIAEKIETLEQSNYALGKGIMVHQGYFYSKPVTAQGIKGRPVRPVATTGELVLVDE